MKLSLTKEEAELLLCSDKAETLSTRALPNFRTVYVDFVGPHFNGADYLVRIDEQSLYLFDNEIEAYKYFPLSICKNIKEFSGGTITVRFKGISGRIDQAAGIAFNIKQNGDYLVVRANPLENNLVLFKMERGKRKAVSPKKMMAMIRKVFPDLSFISNFSP